MNEKDRVAWRERIQVEVDKKGLELNPELERAIDSIILGENCFITGSGGVGKSVLIQLIRDTFLGSLAITASTGVASAGVRGVTMHSLFALPLKPISKRSEFMEVAQKALYRNGDVLKNLDILIVDEASMVYNFQLDTLNAVLKEIKSCEFKPFGGTQIILTGDLLQIPPVLPKRSYTEEFLNENYDGTPFFFHSSAYRLGNFKYLPLTVIYRQKNIKFKESLNRFRDLTFTQDDLDYINERVVDESDFFEGGDYIYLTPRNDKVDKINHAWLETLDGKELVFNAIIEGKTLKSNLPDKIILKEQASVMLLRNDKDGRYVNGTLGLFIKVLDNESILVEIEGETVEIKPYEEKAIKYVFNKTSNLVEEQIIGKRTQYPIKLAYSLTLSKVQGLSLDRIYIDLDRGVWDSGQTYTALSRCRTFEGIGLKKPLKRKDFIENEHLKTFITENS